MEYFSENTRTVISLTKTMTIYNQNGENIGKTLSAYSSWIVAGYQYDDYQNIYYQVATNEFLKADNTGDTSIKIVKDFSERRTIQIVRNNPRVVNDNGIKFDYGLYDGSAYSSDQVMLVGEKYYYRIATNTWVDADYAYWTKGLIDNQSIQSHKVWVKVNSRVYNDSFTITSTVEPSQSQWLCTAIKTYNGHNYYRIATNMWLIDTDVVEILPYNMIIQIKSIAPRIKDLSMNKVFNTYDFGQQFISRAYIEVPTKDNYQFSGYLVSNGSAISIGDADGTTLMYGQFSK